MTPTSVGIWVAAFLTIIILSYVISDNPLYRLAEHVFIGVSVGWTFVLLYHSSILDGLVRPLTEDPAGNASLVVPLVLGLLLLFRLGGRLAWVGNSSMGFLMGAGVALAVSGALAGLLIPQVLSTALPLVPSHERAVGIVDAANNLLIVAAVVAVLVYFNFQRPKTGLMKLAHYSTASFGKNLMMVAFGALFASLLTSRISILVGRIYFLLSDWLQVVK